MPDASCLPLSERNETRDQLAVPAGPQPACPSGFTLSRDRATPRHSHLIYEAADQPFPPQVCKEALHVHRLAVITVLLLSMQAGAPAFLCWAWSAKQLQQGGLQRRFWMLGKPL